MAVRISEISFTKNPESEIFYKESKSNKKQKIMAGGKGGGGVWLG